MSSTEMCDTVFARLYPFGVGGVGVGGFSRILISEVVNTVLNFRLIVRRPMIQSSSANNLDIIFNRYHVSFILTTY